MSFHFLRRAVALAAGFVAVVSAAQAATPTNVYVQAGAGQNTQTYTVGFSRPFDWRYALGRGQFRAFWEAEISGWNSSYPSDRWYTQIGITPTLRYDWVTGGLFFAEAGIGANVIAPHFAHGHHSRFATDYQFGDHLGVGMYVGEARVDEIVLRIEHFSNGGYKQPNPGVNFLQVRYSHGF